MAAKAGSADIIAALAAGGAPLSAPAVNGTKATPLHVAAAAASENGVKALLTAGADVSVLDAVRWRRLLRVARACSGSGSAHHSLTPRGRERFDRLV